MDGACRLDATAIDERAGADLGVDGCGADRPGQELGADVKTIAPLACSAPHSPALSGSARSRLAASGHAEAAS